MDLEAMAYRAVLNVRKVHAEKELNELSLVLSVCPVDSQHFDKITDMYQEQFELVKRIDEALKEA